MYLLDSNVLSALMMPVLPQALQDFKKVVAGERLVTASVCVGEILAGIAVLPSGRRRADLDRAARMLFARDLAGAILAYDESAAGIYADLVAQRRRLGHPGSPLDLMIAAIAAVHDATLVTRNVVDFEACQIAVINPFA